MGKELVFKTDLSFERGKLTFVTNAEASQSKNNAVKALAIVADGFGITNMFYKSSTYEDKNGETQQVYTAHGDKIAELISLIKGE